LLWTTVDFKIANDEMSAVYSTSLCHRNIYCWCQCYIKTSDRNLSMPSC